jgi:capsular polysaccharide transport system permease protein
MTQWIRRHWLFLALVVIPGLAAIIYYGLIASDIYVSESRFMVHSVQRPAASGLASLLQGHTSDEAFAVHDYILSRDALQELDQQLAVRKLYTRAHIDLFDRFPGLSLDRSFEKFYRYYIRHVGVDNDSVSSISVLTVQAFTAEDAYRINSMLLDMSEHLVNTLSDRSREDLIRFADNEVKIASDKAKDASIALLNFRSSHSVFAPDQQAALQLAGVSKIQEELVSTESELAQLSTLSPSSPQITALNSKAQSLRAAIASEASKVTSSKSSLSARSPEFERLTLESGFADKQLGVALAELETARSEARQKQLYLERVVKPNLPDKALQPRRIRSIITVLALGLIVFAMARLLIASVREHSE